MNDDSEVQSPIQVIYPCASLNENHTRGLAKFGFVWLEEAKCWARIPGHMTSEEALSLIRQQKHPLVVVEKNPVISLDEALKELGLT